MEYKSLYMWILNLYIFVYWLLYIQFITSPRWKYIDAFRLELKWLSYLFLFKSNMLFTLLLILSSNQQFYLNLIIHSHPSKALCCQPTLCLDMVSHLTPSRPELYMGRGKLWTQVQAGALHLAPVLGPNAERARGGPQTSLINVVQPRGCTFEAGKSFTTQSNLNSNVLKMQITRPFCCWCYQESQ